MNINDRLYRNCNTLYYCFWDYFIDNTHLWKIVPDSQIGYVSISGVITDNMEWVYNKRTNTLEYYPNEILPIEQYNEYKLPFLSCNLDVFSEYRLLKSYNMDEFIEGFRIRTPNQLPTLRTFYLAWCIYSNSIHGKYEYITLIDNDATEHQLDMDTLCKSTFSINNNKLQLNVN